MQITLTERRQDSDFLMLDIANVSLVKMLIEHPQDGVIYQDEHVKVRRIGGLIHMTIGASQ